MGCPGSNISSGIKLKLIRLWECEDWFESSLNSHISLYIMLDIVGFLGTEKAAPHECEIWTGLPNA